MIGFAQGRGKQGVRGVADARERLIAACLDLLRTKGLKRFTMDELALRAGMSKRTVYRYFGSKEEIIEKAVESLMYKVAWQAQEIIQSEKDPKEAVADMLEYLIRQASSILTRETLDELRSHYPFLWQKIDRLRTERLEWLARELVARSPRQEVKSIDLRIIASSIIASVQAVVNPDFILDNNLTFEETVTQLTTFLYLAFF